MFGGPDSCGKKVRRVRINQDKERDIRYLEVRGDIENSSEKWNGKRSQTDARMTPSRDPAKDEDDEMEKP